MLIEVKDARIANKIIKELNDIVSFKSVVELIDSKAQNGSRHLELKHSKVDQKRSTPSFRLGSNEDGIYVAFQTGLQYNFIELEKFEGSIRVLKEVIKVLNEYKDSFGIYDEHKVTNKEMLNSAFQQFLMIGK